MGMNLDSKLPGRLIHLLGAVIVLLALGGCLVSTEPLIPEQDATFPFAAATRLERVGENLPPVTLHLADGYYSMVDTDGKVIERFRMRMLSGGAFLVMRKSDTDGAYLYGLSRIEGDSIEVLYAGSKGLGDYLTRLSRTDPEQYRAITAQLDPVDGGDTFEASSVSVLEIILPEMLREGFLTKWKSYLILQDDGPPRSARRDESPASPAIERQATNAAPEPAAGPPGGAGSQAAARPPEPTGHGPASIKQALGGRYDRLRDAEGDYTVSLMSPNLFVSYSASPDMEDCSVGLGHVGEEPFSMIDRDCDGVPESGMRDLRNLRMSAEELYGYVTRVATSAVATRAEMPASLAIQTLFSDLKYGRLADVLGGDAGVLPGFIGSAAPSAADTAEFASMSISRGRQMIVIEAAKAGGNCYFLMNDADSGGRNVLDEWQDVLFSIYPRDEEEWPPLSSLLIDEKCDGSVQTVGFGRRFWNVGDNKPIQGLFERSLGVWFFGPLMALYTAEGILGGAEVGESDPG